MGDKILILFAKAPILGRVKTRLVPPLTYQQSHDLHRAFIKDTLERVSELCGVRLYLGYYPKGHEDKFKGLLPEGVELFCQQGRDLGERMQNAFVRFLKPDNQVVIMGTDIPFLPTKYIQDAFAKLNSHDVVIGPAIDGGYYLIGSKVDVPEIFQDMPWGTDKVFELTRSRLKQSGYKHASISSCHDIDRPEDLYQLNHYLTHNSHQLPATREVMASCLP